jgi:hypothetical protein
MSPPKLVLAAAALVLLCAVALGFSARHDQGSFGNPSASRLSWLTDVFPQRTLAASDVAGSDCFDTSVEAFVLAAGQTCAIAIPAGVKRIEARFTAGSANAVLTRAQSVTQRYRATDDPQNTDHPEDVTMPVFGDGTLLALSCVGSGGCVLGLR